MRPQITEANDHQLENLGRYNQLTRKEHLSSWASKVIFLMGRANVFNICERKIQNGNLYKAEKVVATTLWAIQHEFVTDFFRSRGAKAFSDKFQNLGYQNVAE